MKIKPQIKVLIIEDSSDDAELLVAELSEFGFLVDYKRVDNEADYHSALGWQPDIIISDYSMPTYSGENALKYRNENFKEIPFILVSGVIGEELAVTAMKNGADDYFLKDRLGRLGESINQIIEKNKINQALIEYEKVLAETRLNSELIINATADAIISVNSKQKITVVNPAAEKMFRIEKSKIIGKRIDELIPTRFRDTHKIHADSFLNTGSSTRSMGNLGVIYGLRADGEEFPIEATISKFIIGGENFSTVIIRDITERLQAEKTILNEYLFSQSIIDSLPGIFVLIDAQGKILRWNKNFQIVTGCSEKEILEKNSLDFIVESDKDLIKSKITQVFKEGNATIDTKIITKGGSTTPYLLNGLLFMKDNTTPVMIGTGIDITGQKDAEAKLNEALEDLVRSNEELERFAYVVSHDLQEPLRMITSYLNLLERRYKGSLDQDAHEFINFAVDGATRMKNLINDLLAYSRIGKSGNEYELIDCNSLINEFINNYQLIIKEKNIKLKVEPLPQVFGNKIELTSLFQNLIGNSIKFHSDKQPIIHVKAERENKNWVFSIKDNGIGIDPQHFDRIFMIFQRLHNAEEYSGTGIGLSISKRIVERHGGRIWVESEKNVGTTFFFTLPVREN